LDVPNPDPHRATTDKDGKYELRGIRKHPAYTASVEADTATGFLPCQGSADDTIGYTPITIDLKCAKGSSSAAR